MAQLMLPHDIVNNPLLRRVLSRSAEEIEMSLPSDTRLIVHLKKASKRLYDANLRAKLFGQTVVVTVQDTDIFHAINRARRQLFRQVEAVCEQRRARERQRA